MEKICLICGGNETTGCIFTGKRNQCNTCIHKRQHEWYMKKRTTILEARKKYAQENKEHIAEYHKKWKLENKDSRKIKDAQYYAKNRQEILTYAKNYTEKNKDLIKAYKLKYYSENKDYVKAKTAEYLRTPKGKSIAKAMRYRRRLAIKTSIDQQTVEWIAEQLSKPTFICVYCKREFDILKHTIEHFIALKRGGTHTRDNIGMACVHCNCSKGAKSMEEWDIFRVKFKGHIISGDTANAV